MAMPEPIKLFHIQDGMCVEGALHQITGEVNALIMESNRRMHWQAGANAWLLGLTIINAMILGYLLHYH